MREDLKKHFILGLLISIVVGLFIHPLYGFMLGVFAGLLKEVIDSLGYGTPDATDFLYTALGSFVGYLIFCFLRMIFL